MLTHAEIQSFKPSFTNQHGYMIWKKSIRSQIAALARNNKWLKTHVKNSQRNGKSCCEIYFITSRLKNHNEATTTLLEFYHEGKIRWRNIIAAQSTLDETLKQYPMKAIDCRNIDFHFNKGHLQNPDIPMWVIKFKGNSHYVNHVAIETKMNTRETPNHPSTKGSIRIPRGTVIIDEHLNARIY